VKNLKTIDFIDSLDAMEPRKQVLETEDSYNDIVAAFINTKVNRGTETFIWAMSFNINDILRQALHAQQTGILRAEQVENTTRMGEIERSISAEASSGTQRFRTGVMHYAGVFVDNIKKLLRTTEMTQEVELL